MKKQPEHPEMERFEAWVLSQQNRALHLSRHDSPATWRGSEKEIQEHQDNPYEHPWTSGAWEGWKAAIKAVKAT